MGAKVSEQMKKAELLVTKYGIIPAEAARRVGIDRTAIYKTKWYKEFKKK